MMEKIVPMFVDQDPFMVYCLTVSGHLNYNLEENAMARKHWDEVKDLPYSDSVKCYLACQQELELAVKSLVDQLDAAGKLDDTVIVLSADHYPYGLTTRSTASCWATPWTRCSRYTRTPDPVEQPDEGAGGGGQILLQPGHRAHSVQPVRPGV